MLRNLLDFTGLPARWDAAGLVARGAALVSAGSLTLVVMALLVKQLGKEIPTMEILFFRSVIGFFFVVPFFINNPMEPLRTKRFGLHFVRGLTGTLANACYFWTLTHMLLADAMALQFSRPLFMIPLALLFLGEMADLRRTMVALVGFVGIVLYARPFTTGFEPGAFIGAAGAFGGALIVVWIKRLATTEPTRVIMLYYAFWNTVFALIPTVLFWVTPTWPQFAMLVIVAFLGMSGQAMMTHGWTLAHATVLVPLDYSRIVYSTILGFLVFGEMPGPWSFAGMTLIVAASLYLVLTESKRPAA